MDWWLTVERPEAFFLSMTKRYTQEIRPAQQTAETIDIIEFYVGKQCCGVGIMQVAEILRASVGIVPVADAARAIAGVVNLRGNIIPVINLPLHFDETAQTEEKHARIIIFKSPLIHVGFLVSRVVYIHRLELTKIDPPSELIQSKGRWTTGMAKMDERILFLLDLEKIATDIHPDSAGPADPRGPVSRTAADFDRSAKRVIVAEDSTFIRSFLSGHLKKIGYNPVVVNNGLEAWQLLEGVTRQADFKDIADHYHLVIVDIKMPQMDGLQLIRNIRAHQALKKLPCLIYSAALDEETARRCTQAGADGYVVKPQLDQLVSLMDLHVLK